MVVPSSPRPLVCLSSFILCPSSRGAFSDPKRGFLRACRLGIFKRGQIWPFLAALLACIALSLCRWGFGWVSCFCWLVWLFCVVILFCLRAVSTCKGKKALFALVLLCLPALACPCLCLSLCPCVVSSYNRQKNTAFIWSCLLGLCGGGWFLLLSAKKEDCKRFAVSACYCYLVFVCLHSSCRGACDII